MAHAFQRLGRYLINKEIASGGMATVYRAKLIGIEGFEKEVAIKKIQPFWSHKQEFIKMLIDEAKILVHLNHDNIVHVIELGKEKDAYFIVMEYVDGFDLKKILKKMNAQRQTLDKSLVCHIMKEICRGLMFAHNRINQNGELLNIVHRDMSPQNILIGFEGEVKITDFGIAKILGKTKDTQTGVLKGKFSYMSPEQALGQEVDQRTDIFSLGLIFYEMIFGRKCFEGENDLEILEKAKAARVIYPLQSDAFLTLILKKALCKDVSKRYQTVEEFQRDVESFGNCLNKRAYAQDLKLLLQNLASKNPETENLPQVTASQIMGYNTVIAEDTQKENFETAKIQAYQPDLAPDLPKPSPKISQISWMILGVLLILVSAVFYFYRRPDSAMATVPARLPKHSAEKAETVFQRWSDTEPKNLVALAPLPRTENLPTEKFASVTFVAKPWANITIQEKLLQTPAKFDLPPGAHDISIYYPPTGKHFETVVEVDGDKNQTCQIFLKKSKPKVLCEKSQDENLKQF